MRVILSFIRLGFEVLVRNKYRTNALITELSEQLSSRSQSLSSHEIRRIKSYTVQSAITNHWFSLLRGEQPREEEWRFGLYLGAVTPVTDDLMDDTGLSFDQIKNDHSTLTPSYVVFRYLLAKIEERSAVDRTFAKFYKLTTDAQNESLAQQEDEKLSFERLRRLMFDKGGNSTLLYRSILTNPLSSEEERMIYHLGALLQLTNDIFDLHKDYKAGVQTLVTRECNIREVAAVYQELEEDFVQAMLVLNYPRKNKMRAYRSFMIVLSRGQVALDQLLEVQGDRPHIDVETVGRKPLIVDMEKPANIWRSIQVSYRKVTRFKAMLIS